MPYYMLQVSYASSSMSAMIQSPEDRPRMVESVLRKMGGSLEAFWLCFGDYDAVCIYQMPDPEIAAAFSMAVSAGGGVTRAKTTPLLTWGEGMNAMRHAAESGYRPPGRYTT